MKSVIKTSTSRTAAALLVGTGLLLSSIDEAAAAVVTAKRADNFVDTIGVNVHLGYEGTTYTSNYTLLKTRLQEMGIRHYRDGFENPSFKQYIKDRHNELGRLGIRGTFIADKGSGGNPPLTIQQNLAAAALVSESIEAFEGQNEILNKYVGSTMTSTAAATARKFQQDYFNAINASSTWRNYPIIGPSCVGDTAYTLLGDLSAYMDYGNAHAYPLGRGPAVSGSGYFAEMIDAAKVAPGKQFFVTETGYNTGTSDSGHPRVSASAAAKYAPRLFLENFNRGILRSFWYELFNLGTGGDQESNFGLLNNDGSYKPQGTAVRNLTTLLKEATYDSTNRRWVAPTFTPGALDYTLSGNTANVHSTLLQKSNGKFYLCLWQELDSYNIANNVEANINNPNVSVTLTLNTPIAKAFAYYPTSNTTANTLTISNNTINLSVPDQVMIVSLTPAASTAGPNLVSNPGFEANSATQTPSGWSEWSNKGGVGSGYTETGARSGSYRGTQWNSVAYNMYTYQTKTGLANGLYTLRCWVKGSGGQNVAQLEAKDYGGSTRAAAIPATSTWTQLTIKDINVTNGQATIGIWSDSVGGKWCSFDDFEFFKQ